MSISVPFISHFVAIEVQESLAHEDGVVLVPSVQQKTRVVADAMLAAVKTFSFTHPPDVSYGPRGQMVGRPTISVIQERT